MLPEGEAALSEIYSSYPGGYRSIYKQTNSEQVIHWLTVFRDGLMDKLKTKHKNYKNTIVKTVKTYIDEHIEDKLSLNDIASIFGLSPNYLSLLFKKDSDIGFSEYITQKKISRAKVLIASSDLKIYEISDLLGFENAFYFSKVFKKVEGCSPREYIKKVEE
jgi:two-component system response regulator YesN